MKVFVGLDWGKRKTAAVYGPAAGPTRRAQIDMNFGGIVAFDELLKRDFPEASFVVVVEAGAPALNAMLHSRGHELFVVDPKQAKRFAESLSSSGAKSDKHDAKNAWHLAQSPTHLRGAYEPVDGLDAGFQSALRHLEWVMQSRVATGNRLRALLHEEVPALERLCKTLDAKYARDLIRLAPTAWHAAQMSESDWETFVSTHHVPKGKRSLLWSALRDCRHSPCNESGARYKAAVIDEMVTQLDLLLEQEAAAEKRVAECADEHSAGIAQSIRGVGPKIVANVAVRFFPNGPDDDRDAAAKRCSAAPVTIQTGDTTCRTEFRRTTAPRARAAGHMLALQAVRHIPWAAAKYKYDKQRGKRPAGILRQITRALLRIIRAMMKSGKPYDDAKYVKRLKAQGIPWAADLESN